MDGGLVQPVLAEDPPVVASSDVVRLGMPQLSLGGLSETWLLKELGHRHWMLLARMAGREVPDFRDPGGDPVYAAFCAVSIRDAGFGSLAEHDGLMIASRLARVSRTQFASVHRLSRAGAAVGEVELSSVFVKRAQAGRNRSITRVALDGFPPAGTVPEFSRAAAMAALIRSDRWTGHFGFRRDEAEAGRSLRIRPCPSQDFNGADLLYFAAFQAFVDRAEWELLDGPSAPAVTLARDIVYHGNVEVGEAVVATLLGLRREGGALDHWFRLSREGDGARLADVFTRRSSAAQPAAL